MEVLTEDGDWNGHSYPYLFDVVVIRFFNRLHFVFVIVNAPVKEARMDPPDGVIWGSHRNEIPHEVLLLYVKGRNMGYS